MPTHVVIEETNMAKKGPQAPLSEAQLEIMNVVWERGEVAVSEIWEILADRRPLARNTVQTMVVRLEEKGWLTHRTIGKTFLYSAAVDREQTLGGMVRQLVETAFEGSAEGLVLALLQGRGLSRDEVKRIRAMIDKAEAERKGRKS
jgi:predicted transcriptional regulator